MVVAPVDPGAAAEVRRGEQLDESVRRWRPLRRRGWLGGSTRLSGDVVSRRLVGQVRSGNRADEIAVVVRAQLSGLGHLADPSVVELPAVADLLDLGETLRTDDRNHPLLAFGDHDLPRLHLLLAERDAVEADVDAAFAARHLGERRREPRGAAVLERDDQAALDQLEARLDQLLARERVADLHGRPLVGILLTELLAGEHAGA